MKKHSLSLIIFLISTFLIFTPNVKANYGDLRYQITNVSISGSKITFEGWAFIHKTNNYVTVYKLDSNGNETSEILKSNGGQKIKICAVSSDGTTICEEIAGNKNVKYNFYTQMFFRYNGFSGNYIEHYNIKESNGDKNNYCQSSKDPNSDQETYPYSQCYYQDIHFKIPINFENTGSGEFYFTIQVYNNDYGKYTEPEKIYINKNIGSGNDKLIVQKDTISNKVEFIAIQARPFVPNNSSKLLGQRTSEIKSNLDSKLGYQDASGNIYGHTNYEYILVDDTVTYSNNLFGKNPGIYKIYVNENPEFYFNDSIYGIPYFYWSNICNGTMCNGNSSSIQAGVWGSWIKPTGETAFKITVENDKKCPIVNPSSGPLTCNNDKTLTATCNELTVTNNGSRANVRISQTGTISSILTPNEIYAGGGFSLGLIYYNTISWSCISGNCDNNITSAMQSRLQNDFQNSIKLEDITFNGKNIDSSLFVKKCQETGSFTNGNTLTTVCTFFLPKSSISPYNGEITYGTGEDLGINNKYYTLLTDNGKYEIKLKITGMDRLSASSTREDSETTGTPWTGDWSKELTGCSINIYPLLEKPTGTTPSQNMQFNFLYRPIDLNNPFPSRNAGVNWFDWYSVDKNKERLKSSYNRLQYSININNQTISKIKNYNKGKNYLEWDNFENGKSGFVSEYFNIKRQNIVGDE